MDSRHFDTVLTAPRTTRRSLLGGVLAAVVGRLARTDVEGKGKQGKGKHRNGKGNGKKGKKKGQTFPVSPPSGVSGPPTGPVITADATCPGPYDDGIGFPRFAQTFRALRSGQLTSVSVELFSNDEGADFDLEIWSVNETNEPSTILAGTTIINVPATIAPGPRPITGTFAAPAPVVAGLRYALVVTGQPDQTLALRGHLNNSCPDGILFTAQTVTGALTALPVYDLGFATFVTA